MARFIFGSTLDRDDYIIHDLSSLGLDIQTGNSQWFLEEMKGSKSKQEKIVKERICRSKNINPRTITCHHLGYFDINRKNDHHRGFWLYELKPEISSKIHIPFQLVSIPMASGCAQHHIIYDGEVEDMYRLIETLPSHLTKNGFKPYDGRFKDWEEKTKVISNKPTTSLVADIPKIGFVGKIKNLIGMSK